MQIEDRIYGLCLPPQSFLVREIRLIALSSISLFVPQTHKYRNTQMQKYINTNSETREIRLIEEKAILPLAKCTNTQIQKHTNTNSETYKYK